MKTKLMNQYIHFQKCKQKQEKKTIKNTHLENQAISQLKFKQTSKTIIYANEPLLKNIKREHENRPKFLSEHKIKSKNFVIRRSSTPETSKNLFFCPQQSKTQRQSLRQKNCNEKKNRIQKLQTSPINLFETIQFLGSDCQNTKFNQTKLKKQKTIKSKANIRCKIRLAKNGYFPFSFVQPIKKPAVKNQLNMPAQQANKQPFISSISRINIQNQNQICDSLNYLL